MLQKFYSASQNTWIIWYFELQSSFTNDLGSYLERKCKKLLEKKIDVEFLIGPTDLWLWILEKILLCHTRNVNLYTNRKLYIPYGVSKYLGQSRYSSWDGIRCMKYSKSYKVAYINQMMSKGDLLDLPQKVEPKIDSEIDSNSHLKVSLVKSDQSAYLL